MAPFASIPRQLDVATLVLFLGARAPGMQAGGRAAAGVDLQTRGGLSGGMRFQFAWLVVQELDPTNMASGFLWFPDKINPRKAAGKQTCLKPGLVSRENQPKKGRLKKDKCLKAGPGCASNISLPDLLGRPF